MHSSKASRADGVGNCARNKALAPKAAMWIAAMRWQSVSVAMERVRVIAVTVCRVTGHGVKEIKSIQHRRLI